MPYLIRLSSSRPLLGFAPSAPRARRTSAWLRAQSCPTNRLPKRRGSHWRRLQGLKKHLKPMPLMMPRLLLEQGLPQLLERPRRFVAVRLLAARRLPAARPQQRATEQLPRVELPVLGAPLSVLLPVALEPGLQMAPRKHQSRSARLVIRRSPWRHRGWRPFRWRSAPQSRPPPPQWHHPTATRPRPLPQTRSLGPKSLPVGMCSAIFGPG